MCQLEFDDVATLFPIRMDVWLLAVTRVNLMEEDWPLNSDDKKIPKGISPEVISLRGRLLMTWCPGDDMALILHTEELTDVWQNFYI